MNIDWSKAPEDATHKDPDTDCFYKLVKDVWHLICADGESCVSASLYNGETKPSDLIERPKKQEAWDGVCIPPIDSECKVVEGPALWEHSGMSDWIGRNVKVKSTFINNIGQQIASVESDNSECACFIVECLRPIKTAEQLAEEEREDAANKMFQRFGGIGGLTKKQCIWVISEGYRKQ